MDVTIHQFMWGFQHLFRWHVEYEIQKILSHIGLQANTKSKVLLVGFATRDDLPHAVCIEPEHGPLVVDDLHSIKRRTEEIRADDPEANLIISDPRSHTARMRSVFLRSRADAIAEAIEASGKFDGLSFFVSESSPVADYDVHTCVGIPSDAIEFAPKFNNPMKEDFHGWHIEESFLQSVIDTCLARADKTLYLPEAGSGLEILGNINDIVRSSAERFISGITFSLAGQPSDLFRLSNELASLTYERSYARGNLAVTRADNMANKLKVKLQKPVRLTETRSARKMLELSDESTFLLSDSSVVYGLGECNSAPDVAKVAIEGHARWSVSVDDTVLMRVNYEHATLPKPILDKSFFEDICERTVGAVEVERIWGVVQRALESDHGTTIVVSGDPIAEIDRLAQESLTIDPEYLNHEDVVRLGRVDGAIMLGRDGRCYAFGVILDGLATSSGDRARGARFNSSVRYQQTSAIDTMVIVISDDGTVDVIPNLMPRVWRQEVEDAVQAFCEYLEAQDGAGDGWGRLNERVEDFQFYLNQDQCDRVNESYEKEMDTRFASGGIKVHRNSLRPKPDMNDSYFWDS